MARVLNDLSYANYKLSPNIRPLQGIQALYEKKDKDYATSINNLNSTKTALDAVPFLPKDQEKILKAKEYYKSAYDKFREKDDLENQVLNTQDLATDVVTNFGLDQIQSNAKTRSGWIKQLEEDYRDDKISREDMNRAITYADRNYKGVEYNEETDSYLGSYKTRHVLNKYNFAEETAKVMEDFKAGAITLTTKDGQKLIPDGNNGYLNAVTETSVPVEEVQRAAMSYLENSPEFKDYVTDELFYEIDNITYNKETDTNREFAVEDLSRVSSSPEFNTILKSLGISSLEELQTKIDEKDISPEQLYKMTRTTQMANSASALAVEKESFTEQKDIFKKRWLLEKQIDAQEEARKTAQEEIVPQEIGILDSWATNTIFGADDSARVATIYENNNQALSTAQKSLAAKEEAYKKDKSKVNPDEIDRLKQDIKRYKLTKQIVESNIRKIYDFDSEDVVDAQGGVSPNALYDLYKSKAERNDEQVMSRKEFMNQRVYNNLNANKGTLNRLVTKAVITPLNSEDLIPFIKQDKKYSTIGDYINTNIRKEDLEALAENNPEFYGESKETTVLFGENEVITPIDREKVANYITTTLEQEGEAGIQKLKEQGVSEKLIETAQSSWTSDVTMWATNKAETLNNLASELKDRKEERGDRYNTNLNVINLPTNMEPKDKRVHPIAKLQDFTQQIVSGDYHTKLISSVSGLPAVSEIVEKAQQLDEFDDIEVDNTANILWDKATLEPSVDIMRNASTLKYAPTLKLTVPIKSNDNTATTEITIPVANTEESYSAKYQELLSEHRDTLLRKSKKEGLLRDEEQMLRSLNNSLYNLTDYGDRFDLLDINSMGDGEVVKVNFDKGHNTHIEASQFGGEKDKSFYLVDYIKDSDGEEILQDNGEPLKGYWAINNDTGDQALVQKDVLEGYEWTAVGANTADGLKGILANFVYEAGLQNEKSYKVDLKNTIDISSMFTTDVKGTSLTRVANAASGAVSYLSQSYPNLIVTDGLRDEEVDYGSTTSYHIEGMALDFRLNEESKKLLDLDKETLNSKGIKLVQLHNNHIHVEFI